jgi:hypothetical protein
MRFSSAVKHVDLYSGGLVDELGNFRKDILAFGDDLNEMRNYLLMPTKEYSFLHQEDQPLGEPLAEGSETEKALYQFIGQLVEQKQSETRKQDMRSKMKGLFDQEEFRSTLQAQGLSLGKLIEGETVLFFDIGSESGNILRIQSDLQSGVSTLFEARGFSKTLKGSETSMLAQEIIYFLQKNLESIETALSQRVASQSAIETLLESDEIKNALTETGLMWRIAEESAETSRMYIVVNEDEKVLSNLVVEKKDGSVLLNGKKVEQVENLSLTLLGVISQLDGQTELDKMVQKKRQEFEAVIKEEAFSDLLKAVGLKIVPTPAEEQNKVLYYIVDKEDNLEFIFAVELTSGAIKIIKDGEETDLFSALQSNSKKKL